LFRPHPQEPFHGAGAAALPDRIQCSKRQPAAVRPGGAYKSPIGKDDQVQNHTGVREALRRKSLLEWLTALVHDGLIAFPVRAIPPEGLVHSIFRREDNAGARRQRLREIIADLERNVPLNRHAALVSAAAFCSPIKAVRVDSKRGDG